ncbi:MAG: 30S ribosome-binding factor RbfA [Phycisphaerales bacterium]|nr:30S ribosome-binding factor RbfA [Phycisphaerales bacterium]
MPKIRQQKIASQIQKLVAMTLLKEIADPRIDGLISVTRVDVTPDLREARVHLSFLNNKRPPATILEGINSAGRHIQSEVAKGLTMRFVPRLSFHLDESLKREAEILKKIGEANRKN